MSEQISETRLFETWRSLGLSYEVGGEQRVLVQSDQPPGHFGELHVVDQNQRMRHVILDFARFLHSRLHYAVLVVVDMERKLFI